MPYRCPHCDAPAITPMAKWLSGNVRVARCPACGGFAHVNHHTAARCSASALLTAALAVLAFVLGELHPAWLWTGLALASGFYLLTWHFADLETADEGGWKLGRNWLFSLLGLVLLVALWASEHPG